MYQLNRGVVVVCLWAREREELLPMMGCDYSDKVGFDCSKVMQGCMHARRGGGERREAVRGRRRGSGGVAERERGGGGEV